MSLITRCPACSTMFKVVPDQLRISDGWVRCGQCDEVFDANAQLLSERPAPAQAQVEQTETFAPAAQSTDPTPRYDLELPDSEDPDSVSVPKPLAPPAPPEANEPFKIPVNWPADDAPFADPFLEKSPQELSRFEGEAQPQVHEPALPHGDDAPELAHTSAVTPNAAPAPRYQQATVSAHALADDAKLSFLHSGRKASRRSRPWVRRTLVVLCLVLSAFLVLQIVVQERDRIAATEPGTVPALASLCSVLACQLAPLRQIEAVLIDSSSFTKVRTDVYRLSFTLKNGAMTGVATPAVELTLTDSQDQGVVRKVFLAPEFGGKQEAIAPGAELSVSLPLSLKSPSGSERISGYRLLAFYP